MALLLQAQSSTEAAKSVQIPRSEPLARDTLLVGIWCITLFFYGISQSELYRTESLRAIIAAEFLRTGNWIVPTLYGQPLFTKPPGMYAAIALVSLPLGEVREWTARLPAALAASAVVFALYFYFRRALGRQAGLAAALMAPMSLFWLDKASTAEIDMLQLAWVTLGILAFLMAVEVAEAAEASRRPGKGLFGWWLAALLFTAGGFLTKWTAPAFFYSTVCCLLWVRGRLRYLWTWQHVAAAGIACGICLAWVLTAVHMTGWSILSETVSREALMRISPSHHHRSYPWLEALLHPFVVFAGALPWSGLALLTMHPCFRQRLNERGYRIYQGMHCWLWPNLLFWSLIPEHAPRHSIPMVPAYTGLAALVWQVWLAGRFPARLGWWPGLPDPRLAWRAMAVLCLLWIGAKLAFVHEVTPRRMREREPRAKGEAIAALVPSGQTLYLCRFKDEGIMFYYRHPVRRVDSPEQVPAGGHCLLTADEQAALPGRFQLIRALRDEQGDEMYLARR